MNLSNEIFDDYFTKKINKEILECEIGVCDDNFLDELFKEIEKDKILKDAERLENLMYALFLWEDKAFCKKKILNYIDTINILLLMDWHTQHENLVFLRLIY